jgi:hypothetical protein
LRDKEVGHTCVAGGVWDRGAVDDLAPLRRHRRVEYASLRLCENLAKAPIKPDADDGQAAADCERAAVREPVVQTTMDQASSVGAIEAGDVNLPRELIRDVLAVG